MPAATPCRIVGIIRIDEGVAVEWRDPGPLPVVSAVRNRLRYSIAPVRNVSADLSRLKDELKSLFTSLI